MRVLFDVNVLIALLDAGHVHHDRTHRWWAKNRPGGWASCPLTQNGFVRVLSQPGYPNQVSASVSAEFLARTVSVPDHEFWSDDLSITDANEQFDSAPPGGTLSNNNMFSTTKPALIKPSRIT